MNATPAPVSTILPAFWVSAPITRPYGKSRMTVGGVYSIEEARTLAAKFVDAEIRDSKTGELVR